MKKPAIAMTLLLLATGAAAADTVILVSGDTVEGKITKITRDDVTIDGRKLTLPEIKYVEFDGEPTALTTARKNIHGRKPNYAQAYAMLRRLKTSRPLIKAEIHFYRALFPARHGRAKWMIGFLRRHSDSIHYYEANEVMAEMAIAMAASNLSRDEALSVALHCAAELADSPWPTIRQKGRLLRGKAQLARAEKDKASDGPRERLLAKTDEAYYFASVGKPEEGVGLAQQVITAAPVRDSQILARAYNALGACHRAAGRPKDAHLAYLHTDLLYFHDASLRTEARKNLDELSAV